MVRGFENRAIKRILGPKRDEATGEWRKLHNEELNDLHCTPNIVRVIKLRIIRLFALVASIGERRVAFGVLVGKREGMRPLGGLMHKGKYNINTCMDLQEVGWGHELGSSGSGKGHVAVMCKCGNETSVCIQCAEYLE